MGGSSSSSTKRTYQTQNISQQGRANVYGNGNQTTIYRADAITLDNIAAALAAGVEDMSNAGTKQVEAALDAGSDMTRRTLDVTERINRDALDSNTSVTRSAIDSNTSVTRDAMSSLERLSLKFSRGPKTAPNRPWILLATTPSATRLEAKASSYERCNTSPQPWPSHWWASPGHRKGA